MQSSKDSGEGADDSRVVTSEGGSNRPGLTGTYTLSLTTTGAAQTLGRRDRPPAPGHKDPSRLKQRRSPK